MTQTIHKIPKQHLLTLVAQIFSSIGYHEKDAKEAAAVLVSADMRGIESHGVGRLEGYVELWKKQRLNPTPRFVIEHETPSTARINGDKAAGLIAASYAMDIAIKKAHTCGTGWVVVNNSNHFGIAAYHAMKALPEDMIGVVLTNASPLVAPTFSKSRRLGTNPICYAIPAGEYPPVVIDMATTTVANGKLEVAERKGESIPEGWAQTEDGEPSTSPRALKEGGSMLPLGGDALHGGYKGYCLGGLVDILAGVLSGANFSLWVPPFPAYLPVREDLVGEGCGHFIGAMRVDAFRPVEDFKRSMDIWIQSMLEATPSGNEKILIPGEIERENELKHEKNGVPLLDKVKTTLQNLAKERDITLPTTLQ